VRTERIDNQEESRRSRKYSPQRAPGTYDAAAGAAAPLSRLYEVRGRNILHGRGRKTIEHANQKEDIPEHRLEDQQRNASDR
jgi:hypothetical protein